MTAESTLRSVLASQFDEYTVRRRVRVGERNTVYEVTVDGRRAACKLTESQPSTLAREGAIQVALADRIPDLVPDVFETGHGYLLLEWIDGETHDGLEDSNRCLQRLDAVGRTLARLHEATTEWFTGHGILAHGEGCLTVDQPKDWADRFREFVDGWASELTGTRYTTVGATVVERVDSHREQFTDRSSVLVHGEASPDHVLFDGKGGVTLIDWELSQAAPAEFDLVWTERDFLGRPVGRESHSTFRRAIIEGYRSERRLDPTFSFRREMYRAAFAMRELTIVTDPGMPPQSDRDDYGDLLQTYVYDRLEAASARDAPVDSTTDGQSRDIH